MTAHCLPVRPLRLTRGGSRDFYKLVSAPCCYLLLMVARAGPDAPSLPACQAAAPEQGRHLTVECRPPVPAFLFDRFAQNPDQLGQLILRYAAGGQVEVVQRLVQDDVGQWSYDVTHEGSQAVNKVRTDVGAAVRSSQSRIDDDLGGVEHVLKRRTDAPSERVQVQVAVQQRQDTQCENRQGDTAVPAAPGRRTAERHEYG